MAGFQLVIDIRRIEQKLDKLGLVMGHSKYGHRESYGDTVAIRPNGDAFPIYARDTEFYSGSLENLEEWLLGFEFARTYDQMLFGQRHTKARERKEQSFRNKELIETIKNEGKK